jgi:transmembrane sensor
MIGRTIADAVRVDWKPLREEAACARVRLRRRRRVIRRGVLATAAVLAIAIGVTRHTPDPAPIAAAPQLADDATAVPLGTASELRQTAVGDFELVRGAARFHARGPVHVTSGRVTVVASDAMFACSRTEEHTRVEVYRGSVELEADGDRRIVTAGEVVELSALSPPAARSTPPAANPPVRHAIVPHAGARTEDLLLEADVMRLSHHSADAIAPLQRIVRDHADDPRASLAAFTLGRVLLDELGRPREAASAFADALRLSPDGPMSEDALAREVEALSLAGDSTAAHELAEQYLRRFPAGHKARSVRTFGGIE